MATTYGNNARKQIPSITNPVEQVNVAEQGARVRVIYDSYEAAGDVATDDSGSTGTIIRMAKMPKGSRVWQVMVVADDILTAGSLAVGDSGDDDRFIAATVFGAAGKIATAWPLCTVGDVAVASATVVAGMAGGAGIDAFGYEYTSETWMTGTIASGHMTGTIKWAVWYSVD